MSSLSTINIADLIKQIQEAQKKANAANETRYQRGLTELGGGRTAMQGLYDKAAAASAGIGQQAAQDVERGAYRSGAQTRQGLISSGLGNTTIVGSMMRGVEEDRNRAMAGVQEAKAGREMGLATQRAGAEMGASGGIADFIAARNDLAPDSSLYASLIQSAAAAGTGKPVVVNAGLGANARAGLDAFGQKMGGGGSSSSGGGLNMGGGGGGAGSGGAPGGVFTGAQLRGGTPMTGTDTGSYGPISSAMGGATTFFGANGASGVVRPGGQQAAGSPVQGWTDAQGVFHIGNQGAAPAALSADEMSKYKRFASLGMFGVIPDFIKKLLAGGSK